MTLERETAEDDAMATTAASTSQTTTAETRQRKKRKWDQPADSIISAGFIVPGIIPLSTVSGVIPGTSVTQIVQTSPAHQNAVAMVQKLNAPSIQDELIAREIVINDAEPTIRYKLTKRQTQEEIQKCSGAVVITRGKYRPPGGIPDSEKPLYLHISAGSHIKETAERIKAVDRAAAMVEEILSLGQNSKLTSTHVQITGEQVNQTLSTSLYLGFDPDPALNIAARIRGPNDQYINHIMNETGATVVLRGWSSGNLEFPKVEELQQPIHLYLSANNLKSLDSAKLLAENLLDTICVECGVTRVSPCVAYSAVPPPKQMLAGGQNSALELKVDATPVTASTCSLVGSTLIAPLSATGSTSILTSQTPILQPGATYNYGQSQSNNICHPQPTIPGGTCYSGYGGIYPQATPLQQVALALRKAPTQASSTPATTASMVCKLSSIVNSNSNEREKRPPQKRKFQELPAVPKGSMMAQQSLCQGSEFLKPGVPFEDPETENASTVPQPEKLVHSSSNGMLSPPLRLMPPPPPPRMMPPPPPKISGTTSQKIDGDNLRVKKPKNDVIPDTFMKLVEYGEEDEDDEIDGTAEESNRFKSSQTTGKPFWAL